MCEAMSFPLTVLAFFGGIALIVWAASAHTTIADVLNKKESN